MTPAARFTRAALAAIPPIMLTLAIPFANREEPRILGFPFLLAWMVFWVAVTPVFLLTANRLRRTP
ncbi:MAG TPA: DUF3311 domain-containing protein [Candidatus Rubrimentiphilum sp.]|nr:DUF3311 domain-containing protein [Candidatus Rubrimentiphilum sp.]